MDLRIPHPPAASSGYPEPIRPVAPPRPSHPGRRGATPLSGRVPTVETLRAHLVPLVAVLAGLGLLSALAWQQWGSNWWAQRAQSELLAELAEGSPGFTDSAGRPLSSLAASSGSLAAADPSPALAAAPTEAAATPPATPQGAVARITAEHIGLDVAVVGGVSESDLRKGPGWMPGTAPIGEAGNTVISGHRTTYGAPFRHLDRLEPGDRITVTTLDGTRAVYEVRDSWVVKPHDVWVASNTPGARLTLTTCHPVGSDRERLIVQAEMVEGPAAASAVPASEWRRSTP